MRRESLVRYLWVAVLLATLVPFSRSASARSVTDSVGRVVEVPDHITRVVAAGPPASALLVMLAPEDSPTRSSPSIHLSKRGR